MLVPLFVPLLLLTFGFYSLCSYFDKHFLLDIVGWLTKKPVAKDVQILGPNKHADPELATDEQNVMAMVILTHKPMQFKDELQ